VALLPLTVVERPFLQQVAVVAAQQADVVALRRRVVAVAPEVARQLVVVRVLQLVVDGARAADGVAQRLAVAEVDAARLTRQPKRRPSLPTGPSIPHPLR
jgi:hypothetical protein